MCARKRLDGEGSYAKEKNGSYVWACRYTDPLTGERKRKYLRSKELGELEKKVDEFKEALKLGQAPSGNMTVAEWCDKFLEETKSTVKTKTYVGYESNIRNYIRPNIGVIPLKKLTVAQVQGMLLRMSSKGLKPQTVATARRILCVALNRAVSYGIIRRNVAQDSKAPRSNATLVVLDKEEVHRLLEYAYDSRFLPETNDPMSLYLRRCFYLLVMASLDSGARLGEASALQWGDLRGNRIYINRALEGRKIGTPKTQSGYRAITLSKTTLKELATWKAYQEAYCKKWGFWKVSNKSFIFTNGHGNIINSQNMGSRWWRPLLKASGMPDGICWRSLRATSATLLLASGVPVKSVSERLGHSNVSITLAKYAGIIRGIEEQSAVVMDGILSDQVEPPTIDVQPEEE